MCSMHALSTLFSEQLSNINSRTQISNVNKSILHHTCCSTHQNPIQMPATEFWPKEMCKTCNDNRIIFRMLDWFFPLQRLRKRFYIFLAMIVATNIVVHSNVRFPTAIVMNICNVQTHKFQVICHVERRLGTAPMKILDVCIEMRIKCSYLIDKYWYI